MDWMMELFSNRCLWCPFSAWFVAQALKIPITAIVTHRIDFRRFWESGGMPSSHTAMVVSLTIMVGATMGLSSPLLAMCCVFASIVMYDAAGVRRETGRQGAVLNKILSDAIFEGRPISDRELKEIVGHTPFEVFIGFIVGLLVAVAWLLLA